MIKKIFLFISLSILIQTNSIAQYWKEDYFLDFFKCKSDIEFSEINNKRYSCPDTKINCWFNRYCWEREYLRVSDSDYLTKLRIVGTPNVEITFFNDIDTASLAEIFSYIKQNPRIQLLSLKGKIRKLPEDLSSLVNLQGLELYIDKLQSIPSSIGLLKNLKVLTIAGEKYCNHVLSSIPVELNQLVELRYISIDASNLDTIPPGTFDLDKLSHIEIKSEKLRYLEVPFSKISHISHLMVFLAETQFKTKPGNKNSFILYTGSADGRCGESSMYRDSWHNYNNISDFINQTKLVDTYRLERIDTDTFPPINPDVNIGLIDKWDFNSFATKRELIKMKFPKNSIEQYNGRNFSLLNIYIENGKIDFLLEDNINHIIRKHPSLNTWNSQISLKLTTNNKHEENQIFKFLDSAKYLNELITTISLNNIKLFDIKKIQYFKKYINLNFFSFEIAVNSTEEIQYVFDCLSTFENLSGVYLKFNPGANFNPNTSANSLKIKTKAGIEDITIYFDSVISFKQMDISLIGCNSISIDGGSFKKINITHDSLAHNLDINFYHLKYCKTINVNGATTVYNTHVTYYNKKPAPQIYLLNKQNEHRIYLQYAEKLNSTNFGNNVKELSIACFKTKDLKQITPIFLRNDIEFDIGKVIISK